MSSNSSKKSFKTTYQEKRLNDTMKDKDKFHDTKYCACHYILDICRERNLQLKVI